jgi:hypothetical protein
MPRKQSTLAASKPARKPKRNWYQEGLNDARTYFHNMATEPDQEHVFGYFSTAYYTVNEEVDTTKFREPVAESKYMDGLTDGFQECIEELLRRAAIFDGIVKAVKVGSGREKGVARG